jgi:hypothetical protein
MHTVHTPLQFVVFDIDKVVGWKLMTQSQILEVYCAGIDALTFAGQQAMDTERVLSEMLCSGIEQAAGTASTEHDSHDSVAAHPDERASFRGLSSAIGGGHVEAEPIG